MLTARYRQAPGAKLRYVLDLSGWLGDGEYITLITPEHDANLIVDNVSALPSDFTSYEFFVSGGEEGTIYDLTITVTTSDGQKRVDCWQFIIGEACYAA